LTVRGCLVTLAVLVLIGIAATWFALPPVAGTLAQGALVAAGFNADEMTVTVSADPPPQLLTLRADEVRIQANNARYRGLEAGTVDVTLGDVRLADRTFGRIRGTLDLVTLDGDSGAADLEIPHVALDGTGEEVRASLSVPASTVEALATAAVVKAVGIAPSSVVLVAPDRIRIEVGGVPIEARLALGPTGALTLVPPTGAPLVAVPIFTPSADAPFTIGSVEVANGELVLVATLDPVPD
jgi:hypothetical protein